MKLYSPTDHFFILEAFFLAVMLKVNLHPITKRQIQVPVPLPHPAIGYEADYYSPPFNFHWEQLCMNQAVIIRPVYLLYVFPCQSYYLVSVQAIW